MTAMSEGAFVAGLLIGPVVLVTCVALRVGRHPRWVFATMVGLSGVMALAWVAFWYLWGKAFEYGDSYRPVPPALDRAENIAIAVCFLSSVMVAALGASRLLLAWNDPDKSGLVAPASR